MAFTSGLLHDVGKLVLAAVEPEPYSHILHDRASNGLMMAHAEAECFRVTHADVGSYLLTRWGLPPSVVIPVLHHHDVLTGSQQINKLHVAIKLANTVSHSLKGDYCDYPERTQELNFDMDALNMYYSQLPEIIDEISNNLDKVKALFARAK